MLVNAEQLQTQLAAGIDDLGLELAEGTIDRLLQYLEQLHKWNKAINLSGIRDPELMLTHHLLDSLALLAHIDAGVVADVGTGAGLPGIPLAICLPGTRFLLIDSSSKKTRFLFQTVTLLGLRNVEVVHSRVEDYAPNPAADIVTSRAYASLADFVQSCRHLLRYGAGARLLAMKGRMPDAEIAAIPDDFYLHASHALNVPGLDAARCVLDLRPRSVSAH